MGQSNQVITIMLYRDISMLHRPEEHAYSAPVSTKSRHGNKLQASASCEQGTVKNGSPAVCDRRSAQETYAAASRLRILQHFWCQVHLLHLALSSSTRAIFASFLCRSGTAIHSCTVNNLTEDRIAGTSWLQLNFRALSIHPESILFVGVALKLPAAQHQACHDNWRANAVKGKGVKS